MPARLDAIDRKILKELQDDGRITNVELASRVGISAPPCLRRLPDDSYASFLSSSGTIAASFELRSVSEVFTLRTLGAAVSFSTKA